MLAVLGRGAQMEYPGGPWRPTGDYEHWNLKVPPEQSRSAVVESTDDENENCVLGGGTLNFDAAVELYSELRPELVVFGYGIPSPAFLKAGYPSESETTSGLFRDAIKDMLGYIPPVEVFDPESWKNKIQNTGSGTFNEVRHMLIRADEGGFDEIVFVTLLLHLSRAMKMVAKRLEEPELSHMTGKARYEASEIVLMRANPQKYNERIWAIHRSKAYVRELMRQADAAKNMTWGGITQTTQLHEKKEGVMATR